MSEAEGRATDEAIRRLLTTGDSFTEARFLRHQICFESGGGTGCFVVHQSATCPYICPTP